VRISQLADQVGVPVSTVRYYERIGLMGTPARTGSGYRDYEDESAVRLLFVTRARRLGLSCEQISELLPAWGGSNCSSAHDRVVHLIDEKETEIAARIEELTAFAAQLSGVRESLEASPPPAACLTDLSCCIPASDSAFVPIDLVRSQLG
jgi:DNA-binding transcriptional MerR regulator